MFNGRILRAITETQRDNANNSDRLNRLFGVDLFNSGMAWNVAIDEIEILVWRLQARIRGAE